MENLWGKIKKSVIEGASYAAEKTEELTKLGKIKIEILNVKRKISGQFSELGSITYEAVKAETVEKELASDNVKALIETINGLESELLAKEKHYDELSKKTDSEDAAEENKKK
ncbi:hypothetical protein ACFL30_00315 [Candidatus Latescibacterota bacterium]